MKHIGTHVIIKGKYYVKDKSGILGCVFQNITQLKRIMKDAGWQYCTPQAYLIARNWNV